MNDPDDVLVLVALVLTFGLRVSAWGRSVAPRPARRWLAGGGPPPERERSEDPGRPAVAR